MRCFCVLALTLILGVEVTCGGGEGRARFVKRLVTNNEASPGTMTVRKKGNYLYIHDSHVSSLSLSVVDYQSGEELWRYPGKAWRFQFYGDLMVIQDDGKVLTYGLKSFRKMREFRGVQVSYTLRNGGTLRQPEIAVRGGGPGVIHLIDGTTKWYEGGVESVRAFRFARKASEGMGLLSLGSFAVPELRARIGLKSRLLNAFVIEENNGVRRYFVWSLHEKKRRFYVGQYDDQFKLVGGIEWSMPKNTYKKPVDRAFSGEPEPEKLKASLHLVNGEIFLYENYVNYRWSWGRGCNRMTSLRLGQGKIAMGYQIWGQKRHKDPFFRYHFFKKEIIKSNGVMHFQSAPNTRFEVFDAKTRKTRKLRERFSFMRDYRGDEFLCFKYIREHIKDKSYRNAVEISVWDSQSNRFSGKSTFEYGEKYPMMAEVFSDEGLIMIPFYDRKLKKNVLLFYQVN